MSEYLEMTVTCHTPGCPNENIGIVVQAILPDCFCVCGGCGNEITDKVPTTETTFTEE
jgi:hypothetical protein